MPKLSIITPCYNAEKFVGQMIESVRAQTFTDWEHIVVDDGSTDASAAIVSSYGAEEPRLRLVRQSNGGVCKARNNGFSACCKDSTYIYFLDADDLLEPEMLSVMVSYLDQHLQVGLVHCNYVYVDCENNSIETIREPRFVPFGLCVRQLEDSERRTPFSSIFCLTSIGVSLSVLRRSVYEQTSGWDETFGQGYEDIDLLLRLALISDVHYIPLSLYRYRQHALQSTRKIEHDLLQRQKLYTKWLSGKGLTDEQKQVVRCAWHFRVGRLRPFKAFRAAGVYLRQGQVGKAARFYLSATRRYVASYVDRQPKLTEDTLR